MLSQLNIRHLRNIDSISIQPAKRINCFIGGNGSGKTSVLEAVYLLALGRSFRTRSLKQVVQLQQTQLQVTAKTLNNTPVGIQFSHQSGVEIRFNNSPLKRISELASQLPLQYIPANSHQFFEQGPKYRRQLLDWGLFHVEPGFNYHWQAYKKALQQRNAALRQHKQKSEVTLWDHHIIMHGEQITMLRQSYLEKLMKDVNEIFTDFCPEFNKNDLSLKYANGWPKDQTLQETLNTTIHRDLQLGYTRSGTHAADWSFRIDQHDAMILLSRGQQKLFSIALSIAQIRTSFTERMKISDNECRGLLLIDDLNSEIDKKHFQRVLDYIVEIPVQIFMTSTDSDIANKIVQYDKNANVFHVEHGAVCLATTADT